VEVKEAIEKRRAYRSLEPVDITEDLVRDLAMSACLSASCFNNQPWRFVFAYDPKVLGRLHEALTGGNAWAKAASMMIAVFTREDLDCVIRDRVYHLFDTGMATAHIILRATEMGLVAHPIAGFSPSRVREVLGIPEDMQVIALIIVGKKAGGVALDLTEQQRKSEMERPGRKPVEEIAFMNRYTKPADEE
jgi:nitroreductase